MMNRIISFCSGLCLVSLFGFLLIMIVSFSYPNSTVARLFGNNERNITIGLWFINNSKSMTDDRMMDETILELNNRMLKSALVAIKSINEIIFLQRNENYFMSPKVNLIFYFQLLCVMLINFLKFCEKIRNSVIFLASIHRWHRIK